MPAVLWMTRTAPRSRWIRSTAIALTIGISLTLVILLDPRLHYGLLELNLASRQPLIVGADTLARRVAMAVVSLLPMLALVIAGLRWRRDRYVVLVFMFLPPLLSQLWFSHYWIIPILAGITTAEPLLEMRLPGSSLPHRLIFASVLPLVFTVAAGYSPLRKTIREYDRVGERLAQIPDAQWTFLPIDLQPYLAVRFPDRIILRSPSINYLLWNTSQTASQRNELDALVAKADILVDPGLTSGATPIEPLKPLLSIFERHLDEFACRETVGSITLLFRDRLCHP